MTESKGGRRSKRANGEGSIYQRKSDGRWVGSAYVLTTAGTTKRVPVYGSSFEEAHEKLVKLKSASMNGIPVPDKSWSVGEYLIYWLDHAVKPERKATTHRGYESAVRLHILPVLKSKRLNKLTAQDVRQFLAVVREKCLCCANKLDIHRPAEKQCCSIKKCCKKRPSVRQVQYAHAVLRNALSNAVREELISRNVAKLVQVPTPRYRTGQGLSVDSVKLLLKEAEGHRLHTLFLLAATMGLRRGELLGLRWEDLDLSKGVLRVERNVQRVGGQLVMEDTKSEDSDRSVPLPAVTWQALKAHKGRQAGERLKLGDAWQDFGLVFPTGLGTPMEPRNLNRTWSTLRARAGMESVRLHDLRHTMVTLLLELNVPPHVVQAIAGHADIEVTMKVYAHANLEAMRSAMGKLDDHLR